MANKVKYTEYSEYSEYTEYSGYTECTTHTEYIQNPVYTVRQAISLGKYIACNT
jgi:hypothetical protein